MYTALFSFETGSFCDIARLLKEAGADFNAPYKKYACLLDVFFMFDRKGYLSPEGYMYPELKACLIFLLENGAQTTKPEQIARLLQLQEEGLFSESETSRQHIEEMDALSKVVVEEELRPALSLPAASSSGPAFFVQSTSWRITDKICQSLADSLLAHQKSKISLDANFINSSLYLALNTLSYVLRKQVNITSLTEERIMQLSSNDEITRLTRPKLQESNFDSLEIFLRALVHERGDSLRSSLNFF